MATYGHLRFGKRVLVVSSGLLAMVTVWRSTAPTATAQDDIVYNTLLVSKLVEGQPPAGTPSSVALTAQMGTSFQ